MSKTKPSELHQILKTVRLLAVLVGGAVGLAMGNPLYVLAIRLLLLWVALYFTLGLFEVLLHYLSFKAVTRVIDSVDLTKNQAPKS